MLGRLTSPAPNEEDSSRDHDTAVPNSAPTPAVAAMAIAPQSATRPAPTHGEAPPAPAASAPRPARQRSDTPDTARAMVAGGVSITMRIGIAAPPRTWPRMQTPP